jgi:flagellar M-ring protein FliF
MDFLNQAIAQVSDLFRSMTPAARFTAGLLLAVVVVSVGYLFQQHSAGPDEFLFGGAYLPDGQLNQIEGAIAKAGLSGARREGNRILVPTGQRAAYLAAIADGGAIPQDFHTLLENALDKGGPWESREQTRERLKIAKQQMLAEIIRSMSWVENAAVIFDEQAPRGLSRNSKVTSTVTVKPMAGESLRPDRAAMLQNLVSHAIVGMQTEDVAVISLGDGGSGGDGEVYADSFKDPYYQTRVAFEQTKKKSIMNVLNYIPGVRVEVNAVLDDTVQETVQSVRPDKQGTALRTSSTDESSNSKTGDGGGQPGPIANGPGRQGALELLARSSESDTKKSVETSDLMVGGEQTTHQRKGLTPKEVWATVAVPRKYIEQIWKQRNPDSQTAPKSEDLQIVQNELTTKIENLVLPLLDRQHQGESQDKQVQVVVLDSIPAPDIVPPSMASKAMAWTGQYWTTLAMFGVAMFSLMVLRSMVKGIPPSGAAAAAAAVPALTVESVEARSSDNKSDPDRTERTKLRIKKGTSLKDDLADMVREDPDSAAAILKSWIGKAA